MASEYTYSPRMDFFIERVDRATGFEMPCFHIHHKYEIYYEIEGTRRYFIEDAAYIVNAGSVVLIGENQIHKTASVGETPSSRIVMNFSGEYLDKLVELFPDVDFFSFLSEEHNHLLSNITVKQQNHIHSMLQQLLTLQEETTPESDAIRKMLLATLWNTGARINEALALTRGDFSLTPPYPFVQLATLKQRTEKAARTAGRMPAGQADSPAGSALRLLVRQSAADDGGNTENSSGTA